MVVSVPSTVPVPLTRPIGRDVEIATVRRQVVGEMRLITLSGPGGVGKTRLALAVAADLKDHFAGDVAFVDCVALTDAVQLVPVISQALRLDTTGAVTLDALTVALEARRALLILDNLEQIAGVGGLVSRLSARTRRLVVVGTSRARLDVPGEVVLDVVPLDSQSAGAAPSPAVELFTERARAAYPPFALTPDNAGVVEAICQRLDGLPLAIELAAARVSVLAPAAMLARIERQPTVIDGGDRSLPDRHRSLRATLDWSYQLLTTAEQRRFRQLAVFDGAFDRAAAAAVLGVDEVPRPLAAQHGRQTARWLAALERQSLLGRSGPVDGTRRYAMLETVRTHARALLRDDPERSSVMERHLAWYLAIAVEAEGNLNGSQSTRWLRRLDQDIGNLRQALRFATDAGRTADGLRLAVALWRYWESRGLLQEGVDAFDRLLAHDSLSAVAPALRGTALNHLANLLTDLGQFRRAAGLYGESLALRRTVGVAGPVADTLNNLGLLSAAFGDFATARQHFGESLSIRRTEGDRWGEALAIANLGDVEVAEGHAEPAVALHEAALAIRSEIGDERGVAFSISNLAEACRLVGDRTRAGQLLNQAARRFRRLGLPLGEALVRRNRGDLESDDGQHRAAFDQYGIALRGFAAIGDRGRVAEMLERVGATMIASGSHHDGLTTLGAAEAVRSETGLQRVPIDCPRFDDAITAGRTGLGASLADVSLMTGRTLGLDRIVRLIETSIVDSDDAARRTDPAAGSPGPRDDDGRPHPVSRLTPREREVLALIAEGLTNAEIAHRLYVSSYTVNAHLRRIFRQLGVTTRTAAMQRWLGDGGR